MKPILSVILCAALSCTVIVKGNDPWCCNAVNDYGIQNGVSWGSAPKPVQDTWIQKSCDKDENVASGNCPEECTDSDNGKTDIGGDSCVWYNEQPVLCGSYDDDDFKAKEMCCACKACDAKCGCGYYSTEKELHTTLYKPLASKEFWTSKQKVEDCWKACNDLDGCTSFKHREKTTQSALCVLLSQGMKDIKPRNKRSGWTNCLRGVNTVRQ